MTTDGHKTYLEAVVGAFGCEVDYVQLGKMYGNAPEGKPVRYLPAECTGIHTIKVEGEPDIAHISTSYVESQILRNMGLIKAQC